LAQLDSAETDALPRLVKSGHLERTYFVERPRATASTERVVMLSPEAHSFSPRRSAHRQRALLDALALGPVTVGELRADLGNVDAAISRLAAAGVIDVLERRRYRTPSVRPRVAERHERLSDGQRNALELIRRPDSSANRVVLIDGVTGSGKTEVYMRAVEDVLDGDGGCIVLVPEIALTPQTVGRFRARFGDKVAVLHSRLSLGERFDEWERLRSGDARVVVGARSAVFAPVPRLRLIVIDEEHDSSYKHGASPRYHTRAVALKRASLASATLVLGSATPDIESRHACEHGDWHLVRMPERVSGGQLPEVRVVDMAAEFNAGHRSMFSRPLLAALQEVRGDGGKAVLLLNRRGYAPFLLCRECGFVPTCEECSVSLTYHETGRRLECHHCAATKKVPGACPSCGSPYLRMFGAGTQRVEAELTQAFPDLPVVRMDADTTKGKGGHERRLAEFEELEAGILLGTQMVAKGLDYPEVHLVGVLNADTALHLPDYRSAERTFQLVAQVAGRAGRGPSRGLVVVQTYWPEHAAIQAAARHDAESFYRSESKERELLGYPPAMRLVDIEVTSRSDEGAARSARAIAEGLRDALDSGWRVLGPSHACIARVKGKWRWHVLLKAPPKARISEVVARTTDKLRFPDDVTVSVDVDPADIL
ncbi:MAG: primosomal protein N', partial [Coriobacteriia bacterium]|nr:primosomal protein N' [Coriobacteriia bacterium]